MDEGVDIMVVPHQSAHPEIVVEVKQSGDLQSATTQLSAYMKRAGVPLGLVVVGDTLRLIQDSYRGSIDVVGDYDTAGIDGLRPPPRGSGSAAAVEFESKVQDWLESLAKPGVVSNLPEPLRSVVVERLAPIIETSIVRAAGPRTKSARAR